MVGWNIIKVAKANQSKLYQAGGVAFSGDQASDTQKEERDRQQHFKIYSSQSISHRSIQ